MRNTIGLLAIAMLFAIGCIRPAGREVVVYCALDREFSQPIFDEFTRSTGIAVRAKFDTESTKTVGLAEAILRERERPRCDLFWNNEIMHTLRLENEGMLAKYVPAEAVHYPETARSPNGTWHGFAARARVILVNTDRVPESERPNSVLDLADPRWKGRVGLAKPLFGTTATHAACLFAALGQDDAESFFRKARENVEVLAGNKQVALSVSAGSLDWGLTDTDDAIIEVARGRPVAIIYPDQAEGQFGTLFIPNTLAIIQGSPHGDDARRLVDYLLSPEVEARLAAGASAQIPLHAHSQAKARVATPKTVRPMDVDFGRAADVWPAAAIFLRDLYTQ